MCARSHRGRRQWRAAARAHTSAGLLIVGLLCSVAANARPPAEASQHIAVGITDQPCEPLPAQAPDLRDLYEKLLDPSARRNVEPPDPNIVSAMHAAEEERLRTDWANLCRYRSDNAALRHGTARVVFVGDSITELWKLAHPDFFTDGFVDRGIKGQTTAQMLVRFRQDVIALKPSVVHIMGGTYDVAGNGGPLTTEAVRNNIASMIDLAAGNDIRVIVASVPPAGAFPGHPGVTDPADHIVELNEMLRRLAKEKGAIYVDYHEPLADERDAMKQTYSNDGVHPNRDGYSLMELLAHRAIDQALSSSESMKTAPVAKPPKERPGIPRP